MSKCLFCFFDLMLIEKAEELISTRRDAEKSPNHNYFDRNWDYNYVAWLQQTISLDVNKDLAEKSN